RPNALIRHCRTGCSWPTVLSTGSLASTSQARLPTPAAHRQSRSTSCGTHTGPCTAIGSQLKPRPDSSHPWYAHPLSGSNRATSCLVVMKWTRPLCGAASMSQNDFKTSETIQPQEASPVKHPISVLGIDIAKQVFPVVGMHERGQIVLRKRLSRHDL